MKEIQLSQGKVALVDDADYDHLNQWKWYTGKKGYPSRNQPAADSPTGKRRTYFMHWYLLPQVEGFENDHIDRNVFNNQRDNLRQVPKRINLLNRNSWGQTSQYRGVCWHKALGRWIASISIYGTTLYLGSFYEEKEAARAYDEAARANFGFDAQPNFPGEGQ